MGNLRVVQQPTIRLLEYQLVLIATTGGFGFCRYQSDYCHGIVLWGLGFCLILLSL